MQAVQKIEILDVQANALPRSITPVDSTSTVVNLNGGSKKAAFRKFAAESALQLQVQIEQSLTDQLSSGSLEKEIKVRKTDPNTFIHKAILENAPEVLAFLLKHKADVDYPDANGMSPLTIAILSQQPKIVKLLLENRANVSPEKKWNDMSLLEISMDARDIESMEYLLQFGADVNSSFKNGRTPLDLAVGEFAEIGKWNLLNKLLNSKLISSDMLDKAVLRVSSYFGKESDDMLIKLFQKGANINAGNGGALLHACMNHHQVTAIPRINWLLSNGANPNLSTEYPLLIIMADELSIMKRMLELGANPHQLQLMGKDKDGNPVYRDALTTVILAGPSTTALDRVKLLVEAGADINKKTYGKTPLEHALERGRMDVVKYLLLQGENA